MLGKLLGEVLALPVRVVNIPLQVVAQLPGAEDVALDEPAKLLDTVASSLERATESVIDGEGD